MISFGGTYTRQQWGRGLRLAMHPTGLGLIARLLALALVIGAIGLIVAGILRGEVAPTRLARTGFGALVLAVWALQPYIRAWRAAAQPWRGPGGAPSLKGIVTSEGIVSDASATGAVEKWDSFLRAHVRDDMVVLLGTDGLATILPREFFSSEDDWQVLRQMVEFNVLRPK